MAPQKHNALFWLCLMLAGCSSSPGPDATADPAVPAEAAAGPVGTDVPYTGPEAVKIYILAGQSNAEGRGSHDFLKENFPELAGQHDSIWHFRPEAKLPAPFNGPGYGSYGVEFGAGLGVREVVDNDLIFITSAVGGTMLYDRWLPPSAAARQERPTGDLYNRMIRHVHSILADLDTRYPRYKGQGYELAGFIWFQGENDCCAKTQGFYRDNLMDLIKDVRADLGVPALPVVISKINDGCWGPPAVDIWAANEYAAHADENTVVVNTRDLRSLCHYDSQSYLTIGRRVGKALQGFAKKPVPTNRNAVRRAAEAFIARNTMPAETHDMSSLREGLIEYWQFEDKKHDIRPSVKDGTAGTTWFGRGKQGPLGPPASVAGKFGKALKLMSGNKIEFRDYRDPVNAKNEIEQMSVAFWAQCTGGKSVYRIGKGTGSPLPDKRSHHNWYWSDRANKDGWDLRSFDRGVLAFTGGTRVNGTPQTYSSVTMDSFGADGAEWRHQVLVYDGLKKELRLYSNGALSRIRRDTVVKPPKKPRKNAKPLPLSVAAGPLVSSSAPLTLGGLEFTSDLAFQVYDELAIWSRLLSEEEIGKLYNNGHGSEIIVSDPHAAKSLEELTAIVEKSVDAELRYEALRAAAGRGETAVPLLINALNDESPGVRYGAAQSLGERGERSLDLALGLLKHSDKLQRVMGTIMLKHIGKKAPPAVTVPALTASLKDEHFDVRMGAADALGVLGSWAKPAVPALLEAADDQEWWVRRMVYLALTSINTPDTRDAMIDIMNRERHSAMWFQDHGRFIAEIKDDPSLHDKLACAHAHWLVKEEGYYNTFGARGKFNNGLGGLERMIKEKKTLPADVATVVRMVLEDKDKALWTVDDKAAKRLTAILEYLSAAEGTEQ